MLRRLEPDEPNSALSLQVGASRSEPIVPAVADAELETALLPNDQPRWVKDAIALSQRARELIAGLRPAAVHVLSFWDHRIRAVWVGDRRVAIDASGCYRVEG
jgi:hypothetical protein